MWEGSRVAKSLALGASAAGLGRAAGSLQKLAAQRSSDPGTESWEATNLLTVASALVAAASRRRRPSSASCYSTSWPVSAASTASRCIAK